MEKRILGQTGLEVTRIGLGLAQMSRYPLDDSEQFGTLLNRALDAGINFLDTAAAYGNTEELIGRTIGRRRDDYILATKCGHWAGAVPWSAEAVTESIDRSLRRLRTDYVDLVQLHSCGVDVLEQGEVTEALLAARDAGKTRFVGYSGDNEAARWAVESGTFDTLQTTFNLVDQRARTRLFPLARDRKIGVIVKRTIANSAWGGGMEKAHTTEQYMNIAARVEKMASLGPIDAAPENPVLMALGFTLAHPEIDIALIGTTNPHHVVENIRLVDQHLPIPDGAVAELHRRFEQVGADWEQLT